MNNHLRRALFYGLILVSIIVAFILYLYIIAPTQDPDDAVVACTEEALICPDGSGVGREGKECTFAPCPNQASFTGELIVQGDQFILAIPSQITGTGDVTYAIPLTLTDFPTAQALLGSVVTVTGTFISGNMLRVTTLTPASDTEPTNVTGMYQKTLAVGETARVGDVQITLDAVEGDSRCPTDVECIQVGAVILHVTLISDTNATEVVMATDQVPQMFGEYEVSIVNVAPLPLSTKVIGSDSYRVTFQVAPVSEVDSALEQYLRANIDTLSPAKAVLGGTFYITSIRQTDDASAVVQYEDGHIALTADIVFTKTSTGDIRVDEFIIRKGSGF